MPTSSTVWCRSTSRSPVAVDREIEARRACRAARACGRRTGYRWRSSVVPVPSTTSVTSTVVSFVSRGCRRRSIARHAASSSSSAARNASFSSGVPTVTRRHPSTRGHDEKSRTSTPRARSRFHSVVRVAVDAEQQEVGARRAHLDARRRGERREQPARALRRASATRCSISARKSSAIVPASCVGTDKLYGSNDLLELGDHPGRRDREAEPHAGQRPDLRVGAHDDERPRLRRPARARSTARTRRTPRRRRAARRALRHARRAARSTVARGLDGAGRVVRAAHEHDRGLRARDELGRAHLGIDRVARRAVRRRRPRCR